MEYFFEHPFITGIVPVDNEELIEQLNNMELKVGQEINFKAKSPVYIKSIEVGMVILSKDKCEVSTTEEIKWEEANRNDEGIKTIAFNKYGQIIGYNGILRGDNVLYAGNNYTIVLVSRLGDFGLSDTGKLPCSMRVSPSNVTKI